MSFYEKLFKGYKIVILKTEIMIFKSEIQIYYKCRFSNLGIQKSDKTYSLFSLF